MEEGFKLRVPALEAPLRLDLFLIQHFPGSGRKYWREVLADQAKINGRRATKGQTVQGGEEIWLAEAPEIDAPIAANPELGLEVLYEDEFLFAVNKPARLPCHPLKAKENQTVVNAVLARFPEQSRLQPAREAGLVHRLDNDTSGVLLFAKNSEALTALRALSQAGKMQKFYLARVAGHLQGSDKIEFPIGHDPHKSRKMRAARSEEEIKALKARPAATSYRSLESGSDSSLLEVEIAIGARHQIRVHLAELSHPLLGDVLYGGPKAPRIALHALELSFEHPFSGEKIAIAAPLPKDFPKA